MIQGVVKHPVIIQKLILFQTKDSIKDFDKPLIFTGRLYTVNELIKKVRVYRNYLY
jgi:hypothetical protein